MEKKQKGRPPKSERIAKRQHFSVWVSKDQKELINRKIEKSGLSASQFFLTQVLDVPLKRPQIKVLPEKTAELYKVLRMLSGQFAVAVLRASQADMLSQRWQQSSQDINSWMHQLYVYQEKMLPDSDSKKSIIDTTAKLYHRSKELLAKYEAHYLKGEAPNDLAVWQDQKPDPKVPAHDVIRQTMEQLLKQRKP